MKHTDILDKSTDAPQYPERPAPREPVDSSGLTGADWERRIILSRMRELEQENRELKRANEILRRAAHYFSRPCQGER